MNIEVGPGEVVLIVKPVMENGQWTGSVSTGFAIGEGESEDDDGVNAAIKQALDMAVAPMFLEDYPDAQEEFEYHKEALVQHLFPDIYEEVVAQENAKEKPSVSVDVNGNVYTLSFDSETEGSA
jgi:hypothetical protein